MKTAHCKWPFVKLGEYVDLLAGFAFKSSSFTYNASDIPLVKGENLHQGFIDWEAAKKWPSTEYEKHKTFQLGLNDVVLAMDRPWIEAGLKFSWIRKRDPKSLLVQRVARLRGRNGLLSEYLRFIVGSPGFTGYIKPIVTGVNVPHISGDQIRSFRFCLPPIPTQRKIAAILSAYDDLIENNLGRIKILEAMAQNLYREWFVKFRFPGHQQARFTDSPLGRIPEGWEVVPLSSVVDFAKGRKPVETRNEPIAGDVRLLLIDALRGGEPQFTAPTRLVIAETRDTIMVMDGGSSCAVAQGFSGAVGSTLGRFRTTKPDRFSPHALYRFLEEKTDEFKSKNIGAAIPHANKDYILTQMIPLPSQTIALNFHDYLEPIQSTVEILKAKNTTLRHTRDLLLPRLISGEVDVSELDIVVPEEAQA